MNTSEFLYSNPHPSPKMNIAPQASVNLIKTKVLSYGHYCGTRPFVRMLLIKITQVKVSKAPENDPWAVLKWRGQLETTEMSPNLIFICHPVLSGESFFPQLGMKKSVPHGPNVSHGYIDVIFCILRSASLSISPKRLRELGSPVNGPGLSEGFPSCYHLCNHMCEF